MMFSLVNVNNLSEHTVEVLLRRAQAFKETDYIQPQHGTMVNLFYEASTRTCLSFQMAAYRLGLKVLDFTIENSSTCKGESLLDSLQTVDALGVDIAVVRHSTDWTTLLENNSFNLSFVNGGSGIHQHPTQALLDALTIQQHFGKLRDLKVTIVGDISHSRVARSNAQLLQMMGATVRFAGPSIYQTDEIKNVEWCDFDEVLPDSDVVMMLRVQNERHQTFLKIDSYNRKFGLNGDRLQQMKKEAIVMHPGPVNRNVEITDEVFNDPRCKILQQVQNGVVMRMAVLERCLQGGSNGKLVSA